MAVNYKNKNIEFSINDTGSHVVQGRLTHASQPLSTTVAQANGFPKLINAVNIDWNQASYSYTYRVTHAEEIWLLIHNDNNGTYSFIAWNNNLLNEDTNPINYGEGTFSILEEDELGYVIKIESFVPTDGLNVDAPIDMSSQSDVLFFVNTLEDKIIQLFSFELNTSILTIDSTAELLNMISYSYIRSGGMYDSIITKKVDDSIRKFNGDKIYKGYIDQIIGEKDFLDRSAAIDLINEGVNLKFTDSFSGAFDDAISNADLVTQTDLSDAIDTAVNNADLVTQTDLSDAIDTAVNNADLVTKTYLSDTVDTAISNADFVTKTYLSDTVDTAISNADFVTKTYLSDAVDTAINDADIVTQSDLSDAVDTAINDADIVTKTYLSDAIDTAINDANLVTNENLNNTVNTLIGTSSTITGLQTTVSNLSGSMITLGNTVTQTSDTAINASNTAITANNTANSANTFASSAYNNANQANSLATTASNTANQIQSNYVFVPGENTSGDLDSLTISSQVINNIYMPLAYFNVFVQMFSYHYVYLAYNMGLMNTTRDFYDKQEGEQLIPGVFSYFQEAVNSTLTYLTAVNNNLNLDNTVASLSPQTVNRLSPPIVSRKISAADLSEMKNNADLRARRPEDWIWNGQIESPPRQATIGGD